MAAMEVGKKMMEKMGWSKGQGLGKDKQGITSCFVMKKNQGSASQGRIEPTAPLFSKKEVKKEEVKEEPKDEAAVEQPKKRRKKKEGGWDEDTTTALAVPIVPAPTVPPVPVFDIDPRDKASAAAMAEAAAAAAAQMVQIIASSTDTKAESTKSEYGDDVKIGLNGLPIPARRVRVRQWVIDDWRWSKGTEALRYFEEVQLVPEILEVAQKVLGPQSRYPARITDETDCVTEVTAWGSLIVRPRGTGANVPLAKKMLFEILHPGSEDLREEAIFQEDEEAEAALNDKTTISRGMDEIRGIDEGVERTTKGKLKNVGIGAEGEALAELEIDLPKAEVKEMPLITQEDRTLLRRHLEDLRIASGATPVLSGGTLKLMGKDKQIRKAAQLVTTLVETGEWVALTEGFVMSEETKEKRRINEGPSEQILIKVAEGSATKKIELHLKAMERASMADQLKLTSKAVSGKRTLMVQGTKATHERVKLMVKELIEKGESPMLTKALGVARAAERAAAEQFVARAVQEPKKPGVVSAPAKLSAKDEVKQEVKQEVKKEVKKEPVPIKHPDGLAGVVDLDSLAGLPAPQSDGAAAAQPGAAATPSQPAAASGAASSTAASAPAPAPASVEAAPATAPAFPPQPPASGAGAVGLPAAVPAVFPPLPPEGAAGQPGAAGGPVAPATSASGPAADVGGIIE